MLQMLSILLREGLFTRSVHVMFRLIQKTQELYLRASRPHWACSVLRSVAVYDQWSLFGRVTRRKPPSSISSHCLHQKVLLVTKVFSTSFPHFDPTIQEPQTESGLSAENNAPPHLLHTSTPRSKKPQTPKITLLHMFRMISTWRYQIFHKCLFLTYVSPFKGEVIR